MITRIIRRRFGPHCARRENDSPVVGTPANNSDATLQGVYGSFGVRPNTNADVFVINKRDKVTSSPDDDMDVVTFGSRVHGTGPSRIDYSVEGWPDRVRAGISWAARQ